MEEQMRVMNEAYATCSSRVAFNTQSIDYTVNDAYANTVNGPLELEYKTKLRKGGYDDRNLYFLSDLGGGLLGFCDFPNRTTIWERQPCMKRDTGKCQRTRCPTTNPDTCPNRGVDPIHN